MAGLAGLLVVAGAALAGLGTAGRSQTARCTITGTAQADVLKGTPGKDVICGRGGDDRMVGRGGADVLIGGPGADHLVGGGGDDRLLGGTGDDTLAGDQGNNRMAGGAGADTITFTSVRKGVRVSMSTGTVSGGASASFSSIEKVVGSPRADVLSGDRRDNVLRGGGGDDELRGGRGKDWLLGGAGDDTLAGGTGQNRMAGGTGLDTLSFVKSPGAVTVAMAAGTAAGPSSDTFSDIERVVGSQFADVMTGDAADNQLSGGAGDDILDGGDGADLVKGEAGTDTIAFHSAGRGVTVRMTDGSARGAGADRFDSIEKVVGSPFGDTITGDAGDNELSGGAGDDTLDGGDGADKLSGDAGADTVSFSSAGRGVTVRMADGTATGAGDDHMVSFEKVVGSSFDDDLAGDAGDNELIGGDGNDLLQGGGGANRMEGGAGRDRVSFAAATSAVTLDLTKGTAKVGSLAKPKRRRGGFNAVTVDPGAADDTLAGIEDVTGSPQDDTLTGDGEPNTVDGSGGNDDVHTGGGNDTVVGGADNDKLYGEAGDDALDGGPGDDLLDGGTGHNTCNGGGGNDSLDQGSCDSTAPQITAFDFTPQSVDTSGAPQTITVTAHITDDLAGNAGAGYSSSPSQVRFKSPSGQIKDALLSGSQRVSGTATDGDYSYAMQLPRYADHGAWQIEYLLLVDQVGNRRTLTGTALQASGFPTSFDQTGPGDTTAPQLAAPGGFDFSPKTVDTSAAAKTITVTAHITDDLAGNAGAGYSSSPSQVRFKSPSGQITDALFSDSQRVSGTALDGNYSYDIELPRYSEQGTWTVEYLLLVDQAGNSRHLSTTDLQAAGYQTSFEQTGVGDTVAPELADFDFTPKSINTSGGDQMITVTAHITDNLAGNAGAGYSSSPSQVRFKSGSGQITDAVFSDGQRVSGTATDGVYSYTMTVPQSSEFGQWTVQYFLLVDQAGNSRYLTASDLQAAGFPTAFTNG